MRKRLTAIAAAVLGPALLCLIVAGLADHPLAVTSPQGETIELTTSFIALVALVFALLGWAFLAVLERLFPRRAALVWTIVAVSLLLLSIVPLAGEMSTGTRLTLGLAHLLVAAPLLAWLPRRTPPAPAP
ncbi:DUF6069 family protein [Catenuloplanes sp. NPDC051500]|uniref:DUF6069 family protein n=1 Tax=Catenuloplanes sp. NPDC051500 TaxID=3363959 RepID=UPI0037918B5D